MKPSRREFLAAAAATLACPHVARAQSLVDAAGRSIAVPARVERVFPAGPPAAITHYTLQPRAMRYADRVALLGEGSIKAAGRPVDIITAASLHELYGAPIVHRGDVFLPA